MKNTQTIVLQGSVRIEENSMRPYMIVDGVRFNFVGGYTLRTGDYIHFVGHIEQVNSPRSIDVSGIMTFLETIDSREQSA